MACTNLLLLLVIIIITSSNLILPSHQQKSILGTPITTNLHFYFHDIVSGTNQSAVNIIPAKPKYLPTSFGSVVMIDDILTEGPDMSSKHVGKAQGFYAGADLKNLGLLMVMNYVFTEGSKYNGSTLSVMGRNAVLETVREMSIVGGTGAFRFASGFARAKTHTINAVEAVVEYDVTVHHYC